MGGRWVNGWLGGWERQVSTLTGVACWMENFMLVSSCRKHVNKKTLVPICYDCYEVSTMVKGWRLRL